MKLKMPYSLKLRLIGCATLYLAMLLSLMGWVLNTAYRYSLEVAQKDRLMNHVYALLAAADTQDSGLSLPEYLPDARFNQLGSGIFSGVITTNEVRVWLSKSAIGASSLPLHSVAPGTQLFRTTELNGQPYVALGYGVIWQAWSGIETDYTFWVYESMAILEEPLGAFKRTLLQGFTLLGILFLIGQFFLLSWILRPLFYLSDEIDQIELGKQLGIEGRYPIELHAVINNLNGLISSLGRQRDKFKHTLDDLAHSLKTPLAVIRNTNQIHTSAASNRSEVIEEQVARMDAIVQYQLRKVARHAGPYTGHGVALHPLIARMSTSLKKVYRDKAIHFQWECESDSYFLGDEEDAYEILGNVLDNGFKYGSSCLRCRITGGQQPHQAPFLSILVEDDGPGIPSDLQEDVLKRGIRADTQKKGQGIGLAVVAELVGSYQGEITLAQSPLGGLQVILRFKN